MKRISTEIDRLQTMQRIYAVRNQFVSSTPTYKILRFPVIWFLLFFTLFFTACEMPDRDNPWDEKATVDASNWSADGFQIQDVNLTSKKLSWTYTGDNRIEGFQIDRKIGAGEWQEEVYFAGKDERQWVDTNILPDSTKTYTYRLTAVAGVKKSNERTGTVSVRFPGPTALSLQVSTDTTFLLSWTYSSNGHEGFKIDRRKDNEAWQLAVGTVLQPPFTEKIILGHDYYYRVYAYYNEFTSRAAIDSIIFPVLTTSAVINITSESAATGGKITRGTAITTRGVVWSKSQNPTIELSTKTNNGSGIGTFVSEMTGLEASTIYYVRAYATNAISTTYGNELVFTTMKVASFKTVVSPTGKTWMDRNLGAFRVATSGNDAYAYGDLYQWGRNSDGHEKRTSLTTSTLSSSDSPGHGMFITSTNSVDYDWRISQNNNLWQGLNGANNPCPDGFRVPTGAEWEEEISSWNSQNAAGAFNSPLKLTLAGARFHSDGILQNEGTSGSYWSSTLNGTHANFLIFGLGYGLTMYHRTNAYSVRCIKDYDITTPLVSTISVSNITHSYAHSGGVVTSDGGASITECGVVWSISQNPTINLSSKITSEKGSGTFTCSITGLKPSTLYYVRAYATNTHGTTYGSEMSFTTAAVPAFNSILSSSGKIWMDRNLGAARVALSNVDSEAFGDLYQWGRGADGHENRSSSSTYNLNTGDVANHGYFITSNSGYYDWRNPQSNDLWQGISGKNNPCPEGFRIPTSAEWEEERKNWSSNNSIGAYASPLKLPIAGIRFYDDATIGWGGLVGNYWSVTVDGSGAQFLPFDSGNAGISSFHRAYGMSVRCIKD